ncbi:MAG: tetratricopeptide repeat protein [Bacteroidota bacterium]
MYRLILVLGLFSFSLGAQNNEEKLAAQYMSEKAYTKAADIYEELAKKQPESIYYYENLIQCYILMKDFKLAEKLVDKRIKKFEYNYLYRVDKGYLYGLQNMIVERDKLFTDIINQNPDNMQEIDNMANAFLKRRFYEQALTVYIKGRKSLKNDFIFAYEVSELYFVKGDNKNGTNELVNYAGEFDYAISEIKDKLSIAYSSKKEYSILANCVLEKLQKKPDNLAFNDLLIWSFIQQKDWEGAFIQSKSVDKRLNQQGLRLIELGWICQSNEEYSLAIQCFEYVKSLPDSHYAYQAQQGILQTGLLQVKSGNVIDVVQLRALEKEYLLYLNANNGNWQPEEQMQQLAELYIYYLHETQKGIDQLNTALKMPGIEERIEAMCKLSLGDALLINGDPWEADLLYKQVEKAYNTDPLGQEAKFRYARLCYFRGEFEWSQTQLDVLKNATTQLISNNAMRLWLLIQDNIGLDSTEEAMKLFAKADMLIFQNKLQEAALLLDEIPNQFPNHTLTDEIYFSKAVIAEKQGNYNDAIVYYTKVFKDFSFDILADNALINLAKLYEFKLKQPDNAKPLYEKIILNYTGSLFANEARKRYRILRGDPVESTSDNYWD